MSLKYPSFFSFHLNRAFNVTELRSRLCIDVRWEGWKTQAREGTSELLAARPLLRRIFVELNGQPGL